MNIITQAPWTLTHISGSNFAVQCFEIRGKFGDKENCYPIFNKDTSAIDGAYIYCSPQDARLIAAAPELLAALKWMIELTDHANPGAFDNGVTDPTNTIDEGNVIAGEIIHQARQAITKAEGVIELQHNKTYSEHSGSSS